MLNAIGGECCVATVLIVVLSVSRLVAMFVLSISGARLSDRGSTSGQSFLYNSVKQKSDIPRYG